MNPYRKAALMLIRLIAFGAIVFTLFQYLFYFWERKAGHKIADSSLWIGLKTLPLLLGLVLLIKSYAIAKKLTEDFEE